ncbi:alpha/beta fold hydrolase [Streptomyces sp. KR55]|uniref:alpha/beta fold hydrolase n=1 Tax=Streptomyces sp. KR55 TaxID=3457425 RepID=UPI003FD03F47
MSKTVVERRTVLVDGVPTSYLTGGEGPVVLMLHGTYWSRVWLPVLADVAAAGLRPIAVDMPGCGRSGGELTLETATVPHLAEWATRFLTALGVHGPLNVAGHDIGGALAQHLLAARPGGIEVRALALVNAVTYDSWPVPAVARFRDPAVVAATSAQDLVAARRKSVTAGLARQATEEELADYLSPWAEPRVARSWMALAGAAHADYTQNLVPALRQSLAPKLLVWGEDDPFQRIAYAERFAEEIPQTRLVRVPKAGHIPMENDPATVAKALARFFKEQESASA